MKNRINIAVLSGIKAEEAKGLSRLNHGHKIDLNTYFFLHRTGGETESTKAEAIKSKKVDEELIKEVTKYLIENHTEDLESAFGNTLKKERLRSIINTYISRKTDLKNNGFTLKELSFELVNAIAGLDKFESIIEQHRAEDGESLVTDIWFNGTDIWYQTLNDKAVMSDQKITAEQVHMIAKKISNATRQLFTHSKPELDAVIGNLRINSVHEDISPYGTTMAIRIGSNKIRITEESFINSMGNSTILEFIIAAVKSNLNIMVVGGTGSGKTELMKFLVRYIRDDQAIIIAEDTPETRLKELYPEKNIFNWLTRFSETDPDLNVDISRHVRSGMRSNPGYIFATEIRGGETYDVIKAAGTGHAVMSSFHTGSIYESGSRLINMAKEKADFSTEMLGEMIGASMDIVIHLEKDDETGVRRTVGLGEYIGFDKNKVLVNSLFEYNIIKTEIIKDDKGKDKIVTHQDYINKNTMTDKLASLFLKKGVLTPSLLPLVSESFKRNVMQLDTSHSNTEREVMVV